MKRKAAANERCGFSIVIVIYFVVPCTLYFVLETTTK